MQMEETLQKKLLQISGNNDVFLGEEFIFDI